MESVKKLIQKRLEDICYESQNLTYSIRLTKERLEELEEEKKKVNKEREELREQLKKF